MEFEFDLDKQKNASYNPPYDSELEKKFAWPFIKNLHPKVEFISQFPVKTTQGEFRLDFLVKFNNLLIGIECDGKDFHEYARDLWRDVAILENSEIIEVFRFRGSDINYHINECFLILTWYYPQIFDERGLGNIQRLADQELISMEGFFKKRNFSIIDPAYKNLNDEITKLKSYRHNKKLIGYKKKVQRMKENPNLNIKQLIEKFDKMDMWED